MSGDIQISEDPATIAGWAAECLGLGPYHERGVARYAFAGEAAVSKMAYLPGVGWAMFHGMPPRFELDRRRELGSVFVRPDERRKGIAGRLCRALGTTWIGELKKGRGT